jgi:DNA mismatch endonuclease (patch repair protein)
MTDVHSPEKRSYNMSRIKGKNTTPEMVVRRLLWQNGYRYRLHYQNLPGKPDIVFPSRKKVIFVHGCFWHKHECKYFKWPKSNIDFWKQKIEGNVQRDKKNCILLNESGWKYLIVWECETKSKDKTQLWNKIKTFLDD